MFDFVSPWGDEVYDERTSTLGTFHSFRVFPITFFMFFHDFRLSKIFPTVQNLCLHDTEHGGCSGSGGVAADAFFFHTSVLVRIIFCATDHGDSGQIQTARMHHPYVFCDLLQPGTGQPMSIKQYHHIRFRQPLTSIFDHVVIGISQRQSNNLRHVGRSKHVLTSVIHDVDVYWTKTVVVTCYETHRQPRGNMLMTQFV